MTVRELVSKLLEASPDDEVLVRVDAIEAEYEIEIDRVELGMAHARLHTEQLELEVRR